MLPTEHNDPINEKILAISEDKIEGFVREPFEQLRAPLRSEFGCRDDAHRRDAARGNDPSCPADLARD
jgi:hypothetical protein